MKDRYYPVLQHRSKIDQHVAATDQVDLGERGILGQILAGENTSIANRLVNPVTLVRLGEEALPPLWRNGGQGSFRKNAGTRLFDDRVIGIRGKHLEAEPGSSVTGAPLVLGQTHVDGVSFFTGSSAGNPDSDRAVVVLALGQQRRKHGFLEIQEYIGIPEEGRDGDEEVLA